MTKGCKRCGRCCQQAEIMLDPRMDQKHANFVLKRIGALLIWRDEKNDLKALVGRCQYLSEDGKTCMIYAYRPDVCQEHPIDPSRIWAGCRYYDEAD